jgi:hypothetical protein
MTAMTDKPLKTKVLLIEDDDRLAQLISEYLGNYEFAVEVVRRPRPSVTVMGDSRFDKSFRLFLLIIHQQSADVGVFMSLPGIEFLLIYRLVWPTLIK